MKAAANAVRNIPTFSAKHHPAFELLRRYVRQLEQSQVQPAHRQMQLKAVIFPMLYFGAYALALAKGNDLRWLYACYIIMGLALVFIFLNLIHDAVHHALFRSKNLNKAFILLFNLLGANSYVWSIRHRRLHHNFPNVMGWDSDIEQSDLVRVFPHGSFSAAHKNQHLYLPLLYPLYLFNWVLVRDFKDYFNKNKPVWKVQQIPAIEYFKLFAFKAFYLCFLIVIPIMILQVAWWQIAGAYLLLLFTASIFSLLVLLSPHANTESAFPLPDERNQIQQSWFIHQLLCTNDVIHDNWFTRFCMANFNYHIIHHLFPTLNHYHYPMATAKLRELAKTYQLPYRSYPLWITLKNHFLLLKKNGTQENIFEETM